MKLHRENVEIERGGVQGEKSFSIKTTEQAFDILSSGLYTNPILAIVRELSCNAYDAHVAAGKTEVPFTIHLPNSLEPWFAVIDEGIGLDHEGVVDHYTTYFDTTKDQSNKFIGAKGLGSKSPFSYTKSFDVIARFDGTKRIYAAFINEEGVPTIAKMGEVSTDEPNGLEVKLIVERSDFYTFKREAQTALMWFEVKPNIVGDPYFRFNELPEIRQKGPNWILCKKQYSDYGMTAVQGNVPYKVDIRQLDDLSAAEAKVLQKQQLVIFCEIGDFEVAASREEIRYDKQGQEVLTKRIREVLRIFRDKIEKVAKQLEESDWQATVELDELSKEMFGYTEDLRSFMRPTIIKSPALKRYIDRGGNAFPIPDMSAIEVISYTNGTRWGKGVRLVRRRYFDSYIEASRHVKLFVNDLPTGGVARMSRYVREHDECKNVISIVFKRNPTKVVCDDDNDSDSTLERTTVAMTQEEVDEEYRNLKKSLGNPPIMVVSKDTLPIVREAIPRSVPIYRFGGAYSSSTNRSFRMDRIQWNKVRWNNEDSDDFNPDEGGLYMLLQHRAHLLYTDIDGVEQKVGWSAAEVEKNLPLMLSLIEKCYPDLPFKMDDYEYVFAVGSQGRKHVENRDKWYDLFGLLRDLIPKFKNDIIHIKRWDATTSDLNIRTAVTEEHFQTMLKTLAPSSTFYQKVSPMLKAYVRMQNDGHITPGQARLLIWVDEYVGSGLLVNVGNQPYLEHGDIIRKYPMLNFVGSLKATYGNLDKIQQAFEYIILIDKQEETT